MVLADELGSAAGLEEPWRVSRRAAGSVAAWCREFRPTRRDRDRRRRQQENSSIMRESLMVLAAPI